MKDASYQNAFGKAPDSFKRCVTSALSHMEEEKSMKKFSVRLIVIAAILLILMAGVVYAASTEWEILNFVSGWYHKTPVANLQKAIGENDIRQTYQAGDFEVTVDEAIADGKFVYVNANVHMKDDEDVIFLPMHLSPYKAISQTVGRHFYIMRSSNYHPLEGEIQEPEMMVSEDAPVSQDNRSLRNAADEDEERLISATLWVERDGKNNKITSFTVLPDGSISFVLASEVHTDEKALDLVLHFEAEDVSPKNLKRTKLISYSAPLTLPVSTVMETKQADVAGKALQGTDIKLERLDFYLTPLALHYELQFISAKDFKSVKSYFVFHFFNESDKMIMPGTTINTYTKRLDDTHFEQIGSLALDKIPDIFSLKGHEVGTGEWIGNISIEINEQ